MLTPFLRSLVERGLDLSQERPSGRPSGTGPWCKMPDVEAAFDALEATLTKYYALLIGNWLDRAEPAPIFNTHEVFTFPWIETEGD